jgi:hypothetical protein
MKPIYYVLLGAVLSPAFVAAWGVSSARANPIPPPATAPALPAPRPGIWQEIVTTVDGVTVRKVRDTTGGDYNVCYIASRQPEQPLSPYKIDTASAALSITCLPEKRP